MLLSFPKSTAKPDRKPKANLSVRPQNCGRQPFDPGFPELFWTVLASAPFEFAHLINNTWQRRMPSPDTRRH